MNDIDSFVEYFGGDPVDSMQYKDTYFSATTIPTDAAPLIYCSKRLGKKTRKKFSPSAALLWMLADSERSATVNDKAAWLFICGKNILKEGIVEVSHDDGYVLVKNERGEVLGYGKRTGAGITNEFDIGDFLRRER